MIVIKDGKVGPAEALMVCSCLCSAGFPYAQASVAADLMGGGNCGCGCGRPDISDFTHEVAFHAFPQ